MNSDLDDADQNAAPLVSVTIPTMNSSRTIGKCLTSISSQTYPNIETIVMDGGSRDGTIEMTRVYGARLYTGTHLAERRLLGVRMSKGDFILMLDSDQVLSPDAVEKCVKVSVHDKFDALYLTESSVSTDSLVQKALSLDRSLVHDLKDTHPVFGTLLPRFFRGEFVRNISWPTNVMANDHAFIHYACWKAGARMAIVDAQIFHHEPQTLAAFIRRSYQWGYYYVKEVRLNPSIAVTHALPRRVYVSKNALANPWISMLFFLYAVKMLAAASGSIASLCDDTSNKLRKFVSVTNDPSSASVSPAPTS